MKARYGADEIAHMPQATHSQKLAKLKKAEEILERNAKRADDRYGWQVHLGNVLLNFAGAGAIWATGGGTGEALTSAFAGIAGGELMMWTEPGQPRHDFADYQNLTGGNDVQRGAAGLAPRGNPRRPRRGAATSEPVIARGYLSRRLFVSMDRSIDRRRQSRDLGGVADRVDLGSAALLDLVDAQHGVHRNVGPPHPVELALQRLLGGIDDRRGLLAEQQTFDLDEAEEAALADALGVDLVDLALGEKDDLVDLLALWRVFGAQSCASLPITSVATP